MHYSSIFQQLFNPIPRHRFEKSVEKLSGDRYCKHFTAWRQFLACLYAQITGKDSLRELENGLLASRNRLYHLGMEVVSNSTSLFWAILQYIDVIVISTTFSISQGDLLIFLKRILY